MMRDEKFAGLSEERRRLKQEALEERERMKDDFGRRVYTRMLNLGLSQAELARRAGMDRARISSYIRGNTVPQDHHLKQLATALRVNPAELLPLPFLDENVAIGAPQKQAGQALQFSVDMKTARVVLDTWLPSDAALKIMQIVNDNKIPDGD